MRYLVQGGPGRRVSWTLIYALLLPLIILALPNRTAKAQLTRLPQVAVLDFGVMPSVKASGILGRNATDAVVVEMTRTGRYDVTPRAQLTQQLQDLGLAAPLDNIGQQKLGQALGADFISTGDITSVAFSDNPRRAKVTVAVRLTDVVTGELANGAIESGFSPAPPAGFTPDDDTLINQAISNAAFNAVRTINNYTLPTATIIGTRAAREVILNRGGRDGIEPGQEMVVFRGGERVGRVRVTSVNATDSSAAITDPGKGIRPEDRARAIFQLPGYSVDESGQVTQAAVRDIESYKPTGKKKKNIIGVVLGVAAAVLLASLLFSKRSRTSGSGISGVRARAFAAVNVPNAGDITAGRVQIEWSAAPDVPQTRIIEYQIFRDGVIIGVTPPGTTSYTDSPELAGATVSYNIITYGGGTVEPGEDTEDGGGTNTGDDGGEDDEDPSQPTGIELREWIATGLQVGVPHTYQVRVLYTQLQAADPSGGTGGQATGGGGTTGGQGGNGEDTTYYRLSTLQTRSGMATPVARPRITSPVNGTDQRPDQVRVSFEAVLGANQYVVEFADNPEFRNKYQAPSTFVTTAAGQSVTLPQSGFYNLRSASQFSKLDFTKRNTLYFRVGARNASDNPGPYTEYAPNGDSYIYSSVSNPASFNTTVDPPTPPGS